MTGFWRFVPLAMVIIYAAAMRVIFHRYHRKYGRSPIRFSGGTIQNLKGAFLILAGAMFVWQALAAAFGFYIPLAGRLFAPLPLLGTLVLIGGAMVCQSAIITMGASWEIPVNPEQEAPAGGLITAGPFRFSRNPIYLGMIVMMVGWLLLIPTVLSLIVVIGVILNVRHQAIEEEKFLIQAFGSDYQAWAREVGRFLPWFGRLP